MTYYFPSIEQLRYGIDKITPLLPDRMNRTEVATLMLAMELRGFAGALREDDVSERFQALSDQLVEALEKQKFRSLVKQLDDTLSP